MAKCSCCFIKKLNRYIQYKPQLKIPEINEQTNELANLPLFHCSKQNSRCLQLKIWVCQYVLTVSAKLNAALQHITILDIIKHCDSNNIWGLNNIENVKFSASKGR